MRIKRSKYKSLKLLKYHHLYILNQDFFNNFNNLFKKQYQVLTPQNIDVVNNLFTQKNTGIICELHYNKKFVSIENPIRLEDYFNQSFPFKNLYCVSDYIRYLTHE